MYHSTVPERGQRVYHVRRRTMAVDYENLIRAIPDFPQPGILFRDITPLLGDGEALRAVVQDLASPFRQQQIDRVAGDRGPWVPLRRAAGCRTGRGVRSDAERGQAASRDVLRTV